MKKLWFVGLFIISLNAELRASDRDYFRLYGDIFAFLPAMAAVYTLTQEDYDGLLYLGIGTGSTMAITLAIKYSFVAISKNNPNLARISRRPNGVEYEGFPSGHTSSAFSAAGFMQKRYGFKWGLPTTILASLVGISRMTSKRHTPIQVFAGAVLGYSISYFVTGKRDDINIIIDIDREQISTNQYQNYYKMSFKYVF